MLATAASMALSVHSVAESTASARPGANARTTEMCTAGNADIVQSAATVPLASTPDRLNVGDNPAVSWLVSMIHTNTGLIRSVEAPGECNAYTYDQAIAAIALLDTEYIDAADTILDAMSERLSNAVLNTGMSGLVDAYCWEAGTEAPGFPNRAVGPNAWMALAFLHAYVRIGEANRLQDATNIAHWIVWDFKVDPTNHPTFQGAYYGGYSSTNAESRFDWVSTEHCADMLALLRGLDALDYPATDVWRGHADELEAWLLASVETNAGNHLTGAWDDRGPAPHHFVTGYSNLPLQTISGLNELLDSQTWVLLALAASADGTGLPFPTNVLQCLDWLDTNWLVSAEWQGEPRNGFARRTYEYNLDPTNRITSYWTEGTAGYGLARQAVPDATNHVGWWTNIVTDLASFQQTNGSVLYTVGELIALSNYFDAGSIPIAVFSNVRNLWGGQAGVYGEANQTTNSIFYSPRSPDITYDATNVRSPDASYQLIDNGHASNAWASFSLTLAPDCASAPNGPATPSRVVSNYTHVSFHARPQESGTFARAVLRTDDDTVWYWPCCMNAPVVFTGGWQEVKAPLAAFTTFGNDSNALPADASMKTVEISFGTNEGNTDGALLWVDDFAFHTANQPPPDLPVLKVYPNNYAWGSAAGTAWYLFASMNHNPYILPATANGIPYGWLQAYGLPLDDSVETENPDKDLYNNLEEYIADTNPTNCESMLLLMDIRPGEDAPSIVWKGGRRATQHLMRSTGELTNAEWAPIFTNVPLTEITNTFQDMRATNASQAWYHIRATR
jgi:hypothetical protein